MQFHIRFILIFLTTLTTVRALQNITFVALFTDPLSASKVPLESAVKTANMYQTEYKFNFNVETYVISETDSYLANKLLCRLVGENEGITAVFGPVRRVMTLPIVQSICTYLEIPHLQLSWRPTVISKNSGLVLNFYPDPDLLAQAYATIVKNLRWKSFVILYENDDGLIRLQEALKLQDYEKGSKQNSIIVKQLIPQPGPDYRTILKEVYNSSETRIILDCETDHIAEILHQAQEMKLLQFHNSYFLTSLDAHTANISWLKIDANITTVRIIDMQDPNFINAMNNWQHYALNIKRDFTHSYTEYDITTEAVLAHDAVYSFLEAVKDLHRTEKIKPEPLSCHETKKWSGGYRITSYMQEKTRFDTISGPISFDKENGRRINFTLHVVEGFRDNVIARWFPDNPTTLNFTRSGEEMEKEKGKSLQEKTLIVSSRLGEPYLRMAKAPEGGILTGNDRYEGYSMDLIKMISGILGFHFEFHLTEDGNYGSFNPITQSWNGLIKDLLERKADLAICDLTITHQRRDAVDFSLPFMTLGIGILHKKADAEDVDMFAFLKPFSVEVWIYTATLFLAISIILYFVSRMAPADWENPHPCEENPEELENIWDIKNCLWLTLGSIMAQGCDILPKGISSRMVTSMWWFFALIMISSYTANLAAFLTMERMEAEISSAEDLVKQVKTKYGTVEGGATQAFFRESNFSTFQKMWTNMVSSKPSVFEKNNADGVKRVNTTKHRYYAFLMETSQIEYVIETNCELKQVGDRLDSKGYGIAMQPEFPYRSQINQAILQLQENGQLAALKKKWWKEQRTEPSCSEKQSSPEKSSAELALANVGGVFIVLGVGVATAFFIAILEFLWNVRNISVDEHLSYKEALKIELKFAFNIFVTKKRTKAQVSEASDGSHPSVEDVKSIAHSILKGATSFLNLGEVNKSTSKDS